jgi:hypothetical protein
MEPEDFWTPRLRIDVRGGREYLGFAKKKLRQMKSRMKDLGLNILRKRFKTQDVDITIQSIQENDLIRIKRVLIENDILILYCMIPYVTPGMGNDWIFLPLTWYPQLYEIKYDKKNEIYSLNPRLTNPTIVFNKDTIRTSFIQDNNGKNEHVSFIPKVVVYSEPQSFAVIYEDSTYKGIGTNTLGGIVAPSGTFIPLLIGNKIVWGWDDFQYIPSDLVIDGNTFVELALGRYNYTLQNNGAVDRTNYRVVSIANIESGEATTGFLYYLGGWNLSPTLLPYPVYDIINGENEDKAELGIYSYIDNEKALLDYKITNKVTESSESSDSNDTKICVGVMHIESSSSSQTVSKSQNLSVIFGDEVLYNDIRNIESSSYSSEYNGSAYVGEGFEVPFSGLAETSFSQTLSSYLITLGCFDYTYDNSSFITIVSKYEAEYNLSYSLHDESYHGNHVFYTWNAPPYECIPMFDHFGSSSGIGSGSESSVKSWFLLYKINNGAYVEIPLNISLTASRSFSGTGYPIINYQYSDWIYIGKTISNSSVKIDWNKKYMVYTYIITTEYNNGIWYADSRVIGLIDIKTGDRQEWTYPIFGESLQIENIEGTTIDGGNIWWTYQQFFIIACNPTCVSSPAEFDYNIEGASYQHKKSVLLEWDKVTDATYYLIFAGQSLVGISDTNSYLFNGNVMDTNYDFGGSPNATVEPNHSSIGLYTIKTKGG